MTEKSFEEPEIGELSEVYRMLKRDAKDMLYDLLEGVKLWRSTARILFGIAIIAFILGLLFLWGHSFHADFGLIGVFMLGLGAVTTFAAVRYRTKYYSLRKKYSELYELAKKIS